MNNVFLIIGGNLGNRKANLREACARINERAGKVVKTSSIYETEPWGVEGQPHYYNQVLQVLTRLQPDALMQTLLKIEEQMGRVREIKYGARTIDIDILFFNDLAYESPMVTVPHPRIAERRFVLTPMAEIAPDFIHPVFQKNMTALLRQCTDKTAVQKTETR
ncbi:MAG: 2-amino-4-hydroxy-6-hydroxymethyldihydropteridine diphosphokinase [Niabella sp.]